MPRTPSLLPPRLNTPPMNAMRAFEAAARHGNFHRAAEELCVTPGAIAQHIKKLEDWAGARLFNRHAQGVTLTPLAERVLPGLTYGFDALGHCAQQLRHAADRPVIRVAALPAVAQLWLSPRLSEIRAHLEGVEFSIDALDACPALPRDGFDLALYPSDWARAAGLQRRVLAENSLVPVAAPTVANTLRRVDDLKHATLIHDAALKGDWKLWLRTVGGTGIDAEQGPTHSLYSIAVDRCIEGDGVLIGHTALVGRALAEKRLVPVFPDLAIDGPDLCLITPEHGSETDMLARAIAALLNAA